MERVTNEDWMMVFFTKAAASLQSNDITVDNWFVPRLHSPHISFSSNTHTQICQTFDTNKQTIINGQAKPCRCIISIKLLVKCDTLIRYIESIPFIKYDVTHCLLKLWWSSLNWLDIPRLPRQEGPRRDHFAGKWWQYEGGIKAQCYACRLTTWNDYTSHTFPHQNCVNVVMPQFNTAASNQSNTLPLHLQSSISECRL